MDARVKPGHDECGLRAHPPSISNARSPDIETVIASAAKQSSFLSCCDMDCFAALAMTIGYRFAFSPPVLARGLAGSFRPLQSEGAGNAGRPMRPMAACAGVVRDAHALSGHTGITRHSPRNGFTAYVVLSPAIGLSCHRHQRELLPANLTPASRRQDHTILPSASCIARQARCPRPPHPAPRFVTLRNAPLWSGRRSLYRRFGYSENQNIFSQGAGQGV